MLCFTCEPNKAIERFVIYSLIEIFRKIPCESSANDKKQERDLHKEYSTPILDL